MASTDARESTVTSSGRPLAAAVVGSTRASLEALTLRKARRWLYPLATFVVFTSFVVYSTIRAFTGRDYFAEPYLSPFYSPCLGDCVEGSSDFGQPFGWFPLSAALIILIFPLGFRLTCYYYRKAYYRSFWLSPPACGVAEPHSGYSGETRFPLILQNIHRWFWYATFVVALILIWLYQLSCHSCRHIVGGRLRHFSRHPVRYKLWTWVSKLNARHAQFAWYSLFSVALVDLYIFLLAAGVFDDPRFF